MAILYDLTLPMPDGTAVPMAAYRGRVLLVVNTASRCGFTRQYGALESLHRAYGPRGLVVLGCPCNGFGGQEPGEADEIASFCSLNFGVTFPLSAKIEVNGARAHGLFRHLAAARRGLLGSRAIKWNFTKFLVDREGDVVARFGPARPPETLAEPISRLL